ncbi:four-carbon acid sugar kinase family protein [Paenibacillus sp. BC26]|uniref:four-carbon acid sugar kinase family protein n=1 Tax=Paenibacillus sp. BC26 TaxID=1881032 RepID=UPI0008F3C02C|nr:four-carbon acid sugar kinase family protein [Paenibacillus sp. BC26]SFS56007.1 Uncharacterized conserved protein YgbK, DUF1537 family [Paenibacillus sp. BC26]
MDSRNQSESTSQKEITIVLDDDPTGTQSVSGVSVILQPDYETLRSELVQGPIGNALYVLTNTRALPQAQAVALLIRIKADAERAAVEANVAVRFLLRSDSTLRGHVFAEMEALSGGIRGTALFVPAFPECGRVTRGGVHYLLTNSNEDATTTNWIPVAATEFAQDPVFGYKGATMQEWVEEVSHGSWKLKSVTLDDYANIGIASAVCRALLEAEQGTVVVPDAQSYEDLLRVADGLRMAEEQGKEVIVRSASTFASIRCGLKSRAMERVAMPGSGRLLIVCGSHTAASSRQLKQLERHTGETAIVLPTQQLLHHEQIAAAEIAERLAVKLNESKLAIVATERVRLAEHGDLAIGALVMKALTNVVAQVAPYCDGVIAKGGITSADVASVGLGADTAYVAGQLEPGVSLWLLKAKGNGREIPYCVVPGNVGDEGTLVRLVRKFNAIGGSSQ